MSNDKNREACRLIIRELLSGNIKNIDTLKFQVCRKYGLMKILANPEILAFAKKDEYERARMILQLKPVRSISGVNVLAVMTKPIDCPHGKCIYCPGGTKYNVPQSYTGHEPAAMRGIQNSFNPFLQVKSRINQLNNIGHVVNKVELVIMGGTFTAAPNEYQEYFVKNCLDAITGIQSKDLEEAKAYSEKSVIRNVGITFETRPDYAKEEQVNRMLNMGATRVEIGVQTIYNAIYQRINRGHTIEDVIEATRLLKDAGLKVCYHVMPNLPGSSYEKDIQMFKTLFQESQFRPDELKIYPTLVLEGTKLYDFWKRGDYKPLTDEKLIQMLVQVKRDDIPKYVRIKRVMRDIPSNLIIAGPKLSNLRELIWERLLKKGEHCKCIRCHEVGHKKAKLGVEPDLSDVKLNKFEYESSDGLEIFLSFEDVKRDILIGFLRLRVPSEKLEKKSKGEHLIMVRELHIYGPLVKIGEKSIFGNWQHRGFGRKLLNEAEKIGEEKFDAKKILITSGLGAKEYYRKIGYTNEGLYMCKHLT